jgi:hypothetical protein
MMAEEKPKHDVEGFIDKLVEKFIQEEKDCFEVRALNVISVFFHDIAEDARGLLFTGFGGVQEYLSVKRKKLLEEVREMAIEKYIGKQG